MQEKQTLISVTAQPTYIAEESDISTRKFIWSYEITIHNKLGKIIQLLNRCWRITDLSGRVEEITGTGVIGLQPIIKHNSTFTYKSYCQLTTPQGTMEGYYEMQDLEEEHFIVPIPKFILSAPSTITQVFRAKLH